MKNQFTVKIKKNQFTVKFKEVEYHYYHILFLKCWYFKPMFIINSETKVKTLFILFLKIQWKYSDFVFLKNSTKLKIINWITKLINYAPPVDLPFYKEETKKIKKLQFRMHLYEFDFNYQLKRHIADNLAREIVKRDIIKITSEQNPQDGYDVCAELLYIESSKEK